MAINYQPGVIIHCRQNTIVRNDRTGEKFHMPKEYIGPVPVWVYEHPYFAQMAKSGIVKSHVNTASSQVESGLDEMKKKEAAVERQVAEMRAIDEARNDAKIEAEKDAAEQGLDEQGRLALIQQYQEKAVEAVKLDFAANDED